MVAYSELHLPENHGQEREEDIYDALTTGSMVPLTWVAVETEARGHKGTLQVTSDALKLGNHDDNVRATVTHPTAQRLADFFGAVLPTAKISDLVHVAATVTLPAMPQSKWVEDGSMSLTYRMEEYSHLIDNARGSQCGLIDTVGKDWVNTNRLVGRPDRSANYGWHSSSALYQAATPEGGKVWQPVGLAHNLAHADYSQSVRLIKRTMVVDGSEMDIEDVARDPELCWLVSSEGVMQDLRHPAVPRPGEEEGGPTSSDAPSDERKPVPLFSRTLKRGVTPGEDVVAWQKLIGATPDGRFGPKTEKLTMEWQAAHGLDDDGVVGPMTRNAALKAMTDLEKDFWVEDAAPDVTEFEAASSLDDIETVLAANYTNVTRETVKWVVIHSMEAAEKPHTAEAVANWFSGKSGKPPRASAHYNIDSDSIVRSVPEKAVAWHAPGANRFGIGLEHAGYARQTRKEWLDDYSAEMLWLSARLCAAICKRWGIPIRYVDEEGLKRGDKGITTHVDASEAFKKSDHYDPGKQFPMDVYLKMVNRALGGT